MILTYICTAVCMLTPVVGLLLLHRVTRAVEAQAMAVISMTIHFTGHTIVEEGEDDA